MEVGVGAASSGGRSLTAAAAAAAAGAAFAGDLAGATFGDGFAFFGARLPFASESVESVSTMSSSASALAAELDDEEEADAELLCR